MDPKNHCLDWDGTWAGFDQERRAIANAISADGILNLVMVGGDAHMVAVDDGTNTDYSNGLDRGAPVAARRGARSTRQRQGRTV